MPFKKRISRKGHQTHLFSYKSNSYFDIVDRSTINNKSAKSWIQNITFFDDHSLENSKNIERARVKLNIVKTVHTTAPPAWTLRAFVSILQNPSDARAILPVKFERG
jgi:hypothetical protein